MKQIEIIEKNNVMKKHELIIRDWMRTTNEIIYEKNVGWLVSRNEIVNTTKSQLPVFSFLYKIESVSFQ